MQTRSPGAMDVTAEEMYVVVRPVMVKIAEAVRETLSELPPEVAADIYERGLILTGGGALLEGLEEYLQAETKLTVRVADEPRFAIVRASRSCRQPLQLRK